MTKLANQRASVNEDTPLLERVQSKEEKWGKEIIIRLLFCGFLVAFSFGVTQVP